MRPYVESLAETGRLVGEADPPFTQAGEAEVGGYCSVGQRQSVVLVRVFVVVGRG